MYRTLTNTCRSIIIAAMLLPPFGAPTYAQDTGPLAPPEIPGEAIYIPFPVAITLDGNLADWEGVPTVTVTKGPMTSPDPAENGSFTFAVAADMENLYITMRMPDRNIIAGQHGSDFWNEDSFEFYVNASGDLGATSYNDRIFQINVNAADIGNTDPDALTITGVNSAGRRVRGFVFKTRDGWGIEVAVPLAGLLTPQHGLEIGFQAQANGASKLDRNVKLIWSNADTNDSSWMDPSVFGRALFFEIGQTEIPQPRKRPVAGAPAGVLPTENLLTNGDFSAGQNGWWTAGAVKVDVSGGELCAAITNGGTNPWDVIVGQNGAPITAGQTYTITFDARASTNAKLNVRVQQEASPYTAYFSKDVSLTTEMRSYQYTFVSSHTDPAASFQFQIGGQGTPTICVDNVVLEGVVVSPTPTPTPAPQPIPTVFVNQIGYLPNAPKRATVANPSKSPLTWELLDSNGRVVLSGSTTVYGNDRASGDHVHIADFSAYTTPGRGYTLRVGEETGYPFDISNDIYTQLKYDALAYFYHNRSGIEITMPYAGDPQWTRPAGHVGVSPNRGDTDVTCFAGKDNGGREWPGCDYSLDVSGGWYDAGDHGKYVVNGGISVWTLMNQYERTLYLGSSVADFADGTMNIPENDNGIPDLLDEARWEMEFLLKMQIPAETGDPMAGMAHHKVHDDSWTGIPTAPHEDAKPRYLYPPTTAATLNLAATAAQCARIWKDLDPDFSARCLSAAESAWQAAQAHPKEYARDFNGGGSYGDNNVSDEFYWAAAELYITTGKAEYRDYLVGSRHFKQAPVMGWPDTAALGTISLAVVPNGLESTAIEAARANIIATADTYVGILNRQGYLVPFDASKGYWWGSNSSILNSMILMALAYDFTGDATYLNGVSEGMDYILGRNPLAQSYVTGYGERPTQNPHHRFWARQKSPRYPPPPPGALAGGPNSHLQDPYAKSHLAGCAPQKCYVDHIDSYSTNEVAINWNAPLAWVMAFLDEKAETYPGDWLTTTPSVATPTAEASPVPEATPTAGAPAKEVSTQPPRWIWTALIAWAVISVGVLIWLWARSRRRR